MNAIQNAIDDVAVSVCEALQEMSRELMFNDSYDIEDRLTLVKAAVYLHAFLTNEETDVMDLFPFLKDYEDSWDSDNYLEFAEAFVKFFDEAYVI